MEDNTKLAATSKEGQVRQRESNLELFRIITMLLIIAHHYVVNSGLMSNEGPITSNPMTGNSIFLLFFGAWGKIGINCFVIITGYFMCKSQITARKFIKLVLEWLFYNYMFCFIFRITGYESFDFKSFIMEVVPIFEVNKNFTGCFVLFYLLIPFLNIFIIHITEKQHFYLLLLIGFIYIFFGTVHTISFNYVSWFCILYFIASFIRLYPKRWMGKNSICGVFLIVSVAISLISTIVGNKVFNSPFWFVSDSNTFLAIMVGVFAFLFFKNLKIPYNKYINMIAASTFGVLLIHANSNAMRQWLWKDMIDCVGHYSDSFMPVYAICSVLAIFFICVIIDMMRIYVLERPFFKWMDIHWDSFATAYKRVEDRILKKFNISK